MKKIFATLFCAVLAALAICGFAACTPEGENPNNGGVLSPVNLVALSAATDVVARDDIDYFVVAEPAASVRVKATAGAENKLNFVGDLQKLYGGDNGYPQAVIVAKNNLFESKALENFVDALTRNSQWLAAEDTEISDIVNAVKDHITEGMTSSLNEKNLTKEVIANCGIRFSKADADKQDVKSFLTALKAVQPAVNNSPADKFFWNGTLPEAESALEEISVYAPDGAPALALAGLMAGQVETENVAKTINYNIVDATTIQTFVTGAEPRADICILPVNLASNLLGTGDNYTMLGTVTHGNLFILSAKTNEEITAENISRLRGKTVGVVNLAAVPGLTFKLILNKYGISFDAPQA